MTKQRAVAELIFAGALWGFSFVASIWALQAFTPAETLVYRFLIATFVGGFFFLLFKRSQPFFEKQDFFRALPAGVFLSATLLFQVIGLQYTTATKSGFITCLYVILVPLINTWMFKTPSRKISFLFAALALVGTYVLMGADLHNLNRGDLWTLGCALAGAFHIIYIGWVSGKTSNAFRFNNFQSFWCLCLIAPFLFSQTELHLSTTDSLPWVGVLSLGIAASVIAFYLQVRTQKVLTDTTASMLFLLESVFAALFGFLFLNELLTAWQLAGAVIILAASILQILFEPAKTKEETAQ